MMEAAFELIVKDKVEDWRAGRGGGGDLNSILSKCGSQISTFRRIIVYLVPGTPPL